MKLLNDIKAINERLANFERKGLSDTTAYKKIVMDIERSGLMTTHSKKGTIRLSRSKKAIEEGKVTTAYNNQMNKSDILSSLLNSKTVGELKKEARSTFAEENVSSNDIINRIKDIDENREYIYGHLSEWYLLFSKEAASTTANITDYNRRVYEAMKNVVSNVLYEGETYLERAPDYIKNALKEDI